MTETITHKKAVIYARYSSDHQREESIEGQIRECMAYADREGITIIGTYIDRALSAKTDNRPQFLKMIKDSNSKLFNYVIVYQLDRFSRSRYDSATYKAKLKRNGVKVLSAMENISDDPAGILMESVLEGMAEYYSAELSQKVKRGMTENIIKGKYPGGIVPLGYKLTENKELIPGNNAAVISFIFQKYLEGYSQIAIMKEANKKGFRQNSGKPLTHSVIKSTLKNRKYTGVLTWNGMESSVRIPALITEEVFSMAQEKLAARNKKHAKRSDIYMLCSKLTCGKCGASYTGSSGKNCTSHLYYYYVCYNRRKHRSCDAPNIDQSRLEKLVIHKTIELLNNDKILDLIATQCVEINKRTPEQDDLIRLEKEKETKTTELTNCMNAIASGLNSNALRKRILDTEQYILQLESDIDRLKLKINAFTLTKDHIVFFFKKILQGDARTKEVQQKIIDTFINEVIIYDDHIEIIYNYKNELPTLSNIKRVKSSFSEALVDDDRIELPTSCL